jgi:VWFA-related protein
MYDTVVEALPLAQAGQNRKKAMVVISDGNDTNSRTGIPAVQQLIRESEVLVYAIGIDASSGGNYSAPPPTSGPSGPATPTRPAPIPSPFPGARKPPPSPAPPPPSQPSPQSRNRSRSSSSSDRVNPDALRALTDDSGGRTEIIVSARDLDPATAGIADELSKQYFIGYTSSLPKDGKWHSIEVRVRKGGYLVRARKGFIAN